MAPWAKDLEVESAAGALREPMEGAETLGLISEARVSGPASWAPRAAGVVALSLGLLGCAAVAVAAARGPQPVAGMGEEMNFIEEAGDYNTFSLLASTWKIDPSAPFFVKPGRRIFDEHPDEVSRNEFNTMKTSAVSADSSSEFGKKVSAKLGVEGSYGAFSGSAQISLEAMSADKHKMYRKTNSITFQHCSLASDVFDPVERLSPSAKKFLLKAPIERIPKLMGEFFATTVALGGVFQVTTVTTMSAEDSSFSVEAELDANYDAVVSSASASVSTGASSTTKGEKHDFKTTASAQGGDTSIWLQLTEEEDLAEVQRAWGKSVNEENMFPVGFHLVPIWHLLDHDEMDSNKAKQLKHHMLVEWASSQMTEYPPIKKALKAASEWTLAPAGASCTATCSNGCDVHTMNTVFSAVEFKALATKAGAYCSRVNVNSLISPPEFPVFDDLRGGHCVISGRSPASTCEAKPPDQIYQRLCVCK